MNDNLNLIYLNYQIKHLFLEKPIYKNSNSLFLDIFESYSHLLTN